MGRSAQQALNRERRAKLQQLLQHRHVQLKSPAMVFQPPSKLDPKKDKDYKAAFSQQDRANEICRKSDKCAQAWKLVCGRTVLTDLEKYTAAVKKFLDEMEVSVAGTMGLTPGPRVTTASGQLSRVPQSHHSNENLPAQSLRGALPSPTSSKESAMQLPPRPATSTQRSTAMAPPQPYITPQSSPTRAATSQASSIAVPDKPNIGKKRKAGDDSDDISMANVARALRDEGKRIQFNNELSRSGLAWSLGPIKKEQMKKDPEQLQSTGAGRSFLLPAEMEIKQEVKQMAWTGPAHTSSFLFRQKIKEEPKEIEWAGPTPAPSFSLGRKIKEEPKEFEEKDDSATYRNNQTQNHSRNMTRYGGFWSPKEEGQELEKTQYYDFEIY